MDGCQAEPSRGANGKIPNGLDAAQQQRMMAGYLTQQQHQGQAQARLYGYGSQQTNTPIYQLPQTSYGHPSFSVAPSPTHAHPHAHVPTSSMYATSLSTVETQWIRDGCTQSQEQCHFMGSAVHPQSAQAYQLKPYTLDTYMTGTQVHTLAAPFNGGPGSIPQHAPPMAPGNTPTITNELLVTRSSSSSVGPRGVIAGRLEPVSASASQVLPDSDPLFYEGNPIRCPPGPTATDDGPNSFRSISSGDLTQTETGDSCAGDQVPSLNLCHPIKLSDTIPYYSQSSASMLTPASYVLPSVPPRPTPAEVISPVDNPPSHDPPWIIQANMVADQIANSGAERSGSDSDKSSSLSLKIRPNRRDRTYSRRESKPYHCTTPSTARKNRPIMYEGNLERLQQRCKKQGADDGAIGLLGKIFANGVSLEALILRLMDAGVETEEFEIRMGKAYTAFLESTNELGAFRYICRLCHSDQTWKHSKDVLRHLKRDHFGFADICSKWYVFSHF